MPDVEITRTDYSRLIENVKVEADEDEVPLWMALVEYYQVCVPSLITPLSWMLYRRYMDANRNKNESFFSLNALPAIYVQGCRLIESELLRIESVRSGENGTSK